jgi:hypothetical protein
MTSPFIPTHSFVIPDLIGNPWPELSLMQNGQAMDSRLRGNDKVFGCGVVIGGLA